MARVRLTIDGRKCGIREGASILDAARSVGIDIPTLCHVDGHKPTGVCRVCLVEVEGVRALVGACHTPAAAGMVVHTASPRVLEARGAVVELMLAAHTGDCVTDPNADNCKLHRLASDQQVGAPRFRVRRPRSYPVEEDNPYIRRDLSKCVMCRRCVIACRDIAGRRVLDVAYRGFDSKIVAGFDGHLVAEECADCMLCVEYCPTGALRPSTSVSSKTVRERD